MTVSEGPFPVSTAVPFSTVLTPTPQPSEAGATTTNAPTGAAVGSVVAPAAATTGPAAFKGAANKRSGAGVAGFLGLAAFLL